MAIKHISAMTFAVRDMACAIEFYRKLGFVLIHGDSQARFSSLRVGEAFVNLAATSGGPVGPPFEGHWWGRAIFRVDDVDAHHQALIAAVSDRALIIRFPTDGSLAQLGIRPHFSQRNCRLVLSGVRTTAATGCVGAML